MKRIILFFSMAVAVIFSTVLTSCEKEENIQYNYVCNTILADDVLVIYKNITITYEFPNGVKMTEDVKSSTLKKQHTSILPGPVRVTIEGEINEEAVKDEVDYTVGCQQDFTCNGELSSTTGIDIAKGKVLKNRHPHLSSLPAMVHTHVFRAVSK